MSAFDDEVLRIAAGVDLSAEHCEGLRDAVARYRRDLAATEAEPLTAREARLRASYDAAYHLMGDLSACPEIPAGKLARFLDDLEWIAIAVGDAWRELPDDRPIDDLVRSVRGIWLEAGGIGIGASFRRAAASHDGPVIRIIEALLEQKDLPNRRTVVKIASDLARDPVLPPKAPFRPRNRARQT